MKRKSDFITDHDDWHKKESQPNENGDPGSQQPIYIRVIK